MGSSYRTALRVRVVFINPLGWGIVIVVGFVCTRAGDRAGGEAKGKFLVQQLILPWQLYGTYKATRLRPRAVHCQAAEAGGGPKEG